MRDKLPDCYDRCYAPVALLIVVPSAWRHEAILSYVSTGLFYIPILVSTRRKKVNIFNN